MNEDAREMAPTDARPDRTPPGRATSRVLSLEEFRTRWEGAAGLRFPYVLNRGPAFFLLAIAMGLWVYYVLTWLSQPEETWALIAVGGALLAGSALLVLRFLGWRLFVRSSGVWIGEEAIAWRHYGQAFEVPWRSLGPKDLRLAATGKRYEGALQLPVAGTLRRLYLFRGFARVDGMPVLLSELLKRLPADAPATGRTVAAAPEKPVEEGESCCRNS